MSGIPLSVACIGLGRIGAGIARNIQGSGCRLTVYNRDPKKTESFIASGAARAGSPREAAAAADILITCLMDDNSVLENMKGPDGILAGMRPGAIHIDFPQYLPVPALNWPGCTKLRAATTLLPRLGPN